MSRVPVVQSLLLLAGCAGAPAPTAAAIQSTDWVTYNGPRAGDRRSPLAQITTANVGQLREVCAFDAREAVNFQSGIVAVDGVLYFTLFNHTLRGGLMARRKGSMFRSTLLAVLIVGAGGLLLIAQDNAPVTGVQECVVPTAPAAPPPDPAAPPAPPPTPTPATDPLRLYMPDGQLISHGLTVYVTAHLTASQKPLLRLFRSHAITQAGEDEDMPLTPVLVVPGQQWTETFLGRQVTPTGTILMFDTSGMSLGGKAMVRVRPLLYWEGGGCVLGPREINVGDISAITWTVAIVVITLLTVFILARTKRENPMLLLTGVDGHLALSQAQIACWTIVVGSVVLGYGLIHREIPEIPASLIVLMGASLVTGGVAYFQDVKKATAVTVATGSGPAALDWRWGDLIRIFPPDRPPELSLSKAQMLFWTVLLLVLFVSKSILEGGIWEVPWPLVALMGFSQAGYLAPKVADTTTPPANPPAPGP